MAKAYKLTAAHLYMLQTQLGAGVSCGKAENALKDLGARAHKTGDEDFIQMSDAYLKTMEVQRARAEKALGEYSAAVHQLMLLHIAQEGK
jgi:hypothetical protein